MPILVVCPACGAKLSAPDSAAGKKVRCPKPACGTLVPVPALLPAEEVVEAAVLPPPPPKPVVVKAAVVADDDDDDRPRRRSRRDDDDDDHPRKKRRDEEDDDRPRSKRRRDDDEEEDDDRPRKRRRNQGGGGNTGKVVAIVIGSIVVIGGIGFGIYMLLGGSKAPPPPGWKEFAYKDAGFKAYFPREPRSSNTGKAEMGGLAGFGGEIESSFSCQCGDLNDVLLIQVNTVRFREKVPSAVRDELDNGLSQARDKLPKGYEVKSVRWLGGKGNEIVTPEGVVRMVYTDRALFMVTISGPNGGRAKPEEEKAFFDNFQLTK